MFKLKKKLKQAFKNTHKMYIIPWLKNKPKTFFHFVTTHLA